VRQCLQITRISFALALGGVLHRITAPSGRWKNRHLSLVTTYDDRRVFARIERVVSSPACPAALQLMAKFIALFVDGGDDQSGPQP
jgi:hypothetical protein